MLQLRCIIRDQVVHQESAAQGLKPLALSIWLHGTSPTAMPLITQNMLRLTRHVSKRCTMCSLTQVEESCHEYILLCTRLLSRWLRPDW